MLKGRFLGALPRFYDAIQKFRPACKISLDPDATSYRIMLL
jgi:hypothetical protein